VHGNVCFLKPLQNFYIGFMQECFEICCQEKKLFSRPDMDFCIAGTVKPLLSSPLLNGRSLFNGQLLKSQNTPNTITIK
jgi:hypothetical protein